MDEFHELFRDFLVEDKPDPSNVCTDCLLPLEWQTDSFYCRKCGYTRTAYNNAASGLGGCIITITGPNAAKFKSTAYKDSSIPREDVKKNGVIAKYKQCNKAFTGPKFPINILINAADIYCLLTPDETYRADKLHQFLGACLEQACYSAGRYVAEEDIATFIGTKDKSLSEGNVMLRQHAIGKYKVRHPDPIIRAAHIAFSKIYIDADDDIIALIINIAHWTLRHHISLSSGENARIAATIKYYHSNIQQLTTKSGVLLDDTLITQGIGITSITFNRIYNELAAKNDTIKRKIRHGMLARDKKD
jgi:hypothetical protein